MTVQAFGQMDAHTEGQPLIFIYFWIPVFAYCCSGFVFCFRVYAHLQPDYDEFLLCSTHMITYGFSIAQIYYASIDCAFINNSHTYV